MLLLAAVRSTLQVFMVCSMKFMTSCDILLFLFFLCNTRLTFFVACFRTFLWTCVFTLACCFNSFLLFLFLFSLYIFHKIHRHLPNWSEIVSLSSHFCLVLKQLFPTLLSIYLLDLFQPFFQIKPSVHKNAACNPEQVLAATPHKTPTVRPPAPYHEN